MEFYHQPVLLEETVSLLNVRPDGTYLDGTVGGGGHASEVVRRLSGKGRFIGIDQDEEAVEASRKRLEPLGKNVTIVRENYRNFDKVLDGLHIEKTDGILLDLGVSSHQFDDGERGFSYRFDAPLDMRMDTRSERTAKDLVNGLSEPELIRILRDYGEERFAPAIAANIVKERAVKPIETTFELVEIIRRSMPARIVREGGHPAKQTFQALRIALNDELGVLEDSLDRMIDRLNPGGRLAVITFHSLEDRIVKQHFKTNEDPCICPKDFPVCVCGRKSKGHAVTRKPVTATEKEAEENLRARSAHLRVFEKN